MKSPLWASRTDCLKKIIDALAAAGAQFQRRIKFSSFDHENLALLAKWAKDGVCQTYPLCALFNGENEEVPENFVEHCRGLGNDVGKVVEVHLRFTRTSADVVKKAHEAGMAVMSWYGGSCDDSVKELQDVIDCGVDQLCTNRPDRLLTMLGRRPINTELPPLFARGFDL